MIYFIMKYVVIINDLLNPVMKHPTQINCVGMNESKDVIGMRVKEVIRKVKHIVSVVVSLEGGLSRR